MKYNQFETIERLRDQERIEKMKLRDVLAVPFWLLAIWLEILSLIIGGKWTSLTYIQNAKKIGKALQDNK